ncbi:Dirigent protein 23 [Linum grandiflorum]
MSPLFVLTFLLLSAAVSGHGHGHGHHHRHGHDKPSPVKWATRKESCRKDTVTNLQFYFHDIVSGKNPTAVRVAQAAVTDKSPSFFGLVMMVDDPLTETADLSSKLIGRAQGIYGFASQNDVSLIMGLSYNFLVGKNPAMNPDRELPVVGGVGVFRMARGYALLKTVSLTKDGNAVVHYNVTVHTPPADCN